jgi:hypothetical protein
VTGVNPPGVLDPTAGMPCLVRAAVVVSPHVDVDIAACE